MKKLFSFLFAFSVSTLSLNASEAGIAITGQEKFIQTKASIAAAKEKELKDARARAVFPLTPETTARKLADRGADLPTGSIEVYSIIGYGTPSYFVRRKSQSGDYVLQATRGGSPTQESFSAGTEIYRTELGSGKTISDEELIKKLDSLRGFTTPPTQTKKVHHSA